MWAVGDGADGGPEGREVAATMASMRFHRLFYLGDVYPSGTAADYAGKYAPVFGPFAPKTAPVPGNHEWAKRAEGYIPYWTAARGAPAPLHYAFSLSGWQVLALNSNTPDDPTQLAWLDAKLRATPRFGTCRIAIFHHPRFSAALTHGDDPKMEPLWAMLAGRVRIALSGHDHVNQRLLPVGGITQFVAGAGGYERYSLDFADPRLAFGDDQHHAALRLALRRGRAAASFVSSDGGVLDRSEHRCRSKI